MSVLRVETAADLAVAAAEFGVGLSERASETLFRHLELVYLWNRSAGLTSISEADAPRLHLLDSLAASPWLGEATTAADLGAGAGFPGIPLAVLHPQVLFTLVEKNRRKCSFLRDAVARQHLGNVRIEESDSRKLCEAGRLFDCVISRAFRPPAQFLGVAEPLAARGGRVIVMAADLDDAEVDVLRAAQPQLDLECRQAFRLAGRENRSLLIFRKAG